MFDGKINYHHSIWRIWREKLTPTPYLEIVQQTKNLAIYIYICGNVKISALSLMHQRALLGRLYPQQCAGCFSPSFACDFLEGARVQNHGIFYSSRWFRFPPTKFHCGSKAQFVDIWPWQVFKDQGQEFTEVVCDFLFDLPSGELT